MGWNWVGWPALEAIFTGILAVGIVTVFFQIKETRKSTRRSTGAQLAVDLIQLFRDEQVKETLRYIYDLKDTSNLQDGEKHRIEGVFDRFTLLGDLVNKGIIDEDMAIEIGPSALRCWYRLVGYLREERQERGYMYEKYEGFAERVLARYQEEGHDVFLCDDSGNNVNLVTELANKDIRPRSFKQIEAENKSKRKI